MDRLRRGRARGAGSSGSAARRGLHQTCDRTDQDLQGGRCSSVPGRQWTPCAGLCVTDRRQVHGCFCPRNQATRLLYSRVAVLRSRLLLSATRARARKIRISCIGDTMQIRSATSSDLSAVERLLVASDLPTDGVRDNFSRFVVADDDGSIAGAIGLEKYGSVALLRSAGVFPPPPWRGGGRKPRAAILARRPGGWGGRGLLPTPAPAR